jgi:hypothetical protein
MRLTTRRARIHYFGMEPGRNSACPCGSGKKFKSCCEGAEQRKLDSRTRVMGLALTLVAAGGILAASYALITG